MRYNKIRNGAISFVLGFAVLLQSGFVVPVSAAGIGFTLSLHYQESKDDDKSDMRLNETHPIYLPNGLNSMHVDVVTEDDIYTDYTLNPEAPNRIIGYTFKGWYRKSGFDGLSGDYLQDEYKVGESITDDRLPSTRMLHLYGVWEEYASPYLNSGSVSFERKNKNGELTEENITWTEADGSTPETFNFDRERETYQGYTYGDLKSIRMRFEQYEPDAKIEVNVNGQDIEYQSEDIKDQNGYWYPQEYIISSDEGEHDSTHPIIITGVNQTINVTANTNFSGDIIKEGGCLAIKYYARAAMNVRMNIITTDGAKQLFPTRTVASSEEQGTYIAYYTYNDLVSTFGGNDFSSVIGISITNRGTTADIEDKTLVWQRLSWWDVTDPPSQQSTLQRHEIVTGKTITTDYFDLDYTSAQQEYNTVNIKVKLPKVVQQLVPSGDGGMQYEEVLDYEQGYSKTYTFKIKRYNRELTPYYGNTPYGRIMQNDVADSLKQLQKDSFDLNYTYRNGSYTSKAWWHSPNTTEKDEIKRGSTPTGNQYINYDKDETAIVVYSGDRFRDTGVTLNYDGVQIAPTAAKPIKRTITFKALDDSLKYRKWAQATERSVSKNLTGAEDDNIIDVLQTYNVVPGVYTINYEYDLGENITPLTAHRYMIVLPKLTTSHASNHYDINMDNYVNALDVLIYDDTANGGIAAESDASYSTISEYLYRYRVLDVNQRGRNDGKVTSADKDYVLNDTQNDATVYEIYPSLSVPEEVTQVAYTPSLNANHAQLYMEYLGKDADTARTLYNGASNTLRDGTEKLSKNDIFFIGYRFNNISKLSNGRLNEITLTVTYDRRYVSPRAETSEALESYIKMLNPHLVEGSELKFDVKSTVNGHYDVDNSTAFIHWNGADASQAGDISQLRTLKIEMYLKSGKGFNITDDAYFIKLPFAVNNVPKNDGRKVITTQLGANTLNLNTGSNAVFMWDGGYMWDTTGKTSAVTANLKNSLDYMGDYMPQFDEEASYIDLYERHPATYGVPIGYVGFDTKGSIEPEIDGEAPLPQGLIYDDTAGTISGTPRETGEFIFYLNGVKYRLYVDKAELKVKAKSLKPVIYGDANPQIAFDYDEELLKTNDDWDETAKRPKSGVIKTEPVPVCGVTATTEVTKSFPITFNKIGDSDFYTFVYEDGEIEVVQREIEITKATQPVSISKTAIPGGAVYMEDNSTTTTLGVSGLVNGDQIGVWYNAQFKDTTVPSSLPATNRPVDIIDITIKTDAFPKGKNYKLKSNFLPQQNIGTITDTQMKSIIRAEGLRIDYTYGETLDLNTGTVRVRYDDGSTVPMTFLYAQNAGIFLCYRENNVIDVNKIPVHGEKLSVSDSGKSLWLCLDRNNPYAEFSYTNPITVHKKELHVKADDKVRYYGDDNPTLFDNLNTNVDGKYSFTLTDSDEIVKSVSYTKIDGTTGTTNYGDTEAAIRAEINSKSNMMMYTTALSDDTEADADTEIDKEKGYTEADIVLTAEDVLANYVLVPEKGTLTINKRPLTVTKINSAATLTSNYYQDDSSVNQTAPYYAPALDENSSTAIAGKLPDGETATMSVTNLHTRNGETEADPVRIQYHAQYNTLPNPLEDTNNVSVRFVHKKADGSGFEAGAAMDDSYGLSYNYTVKNDSITDDTIGRVLTRKIKNIKINDWLQTKYVFGTKTDYTTGSVTIEYDNGHKYEDLSFEDVMDEDVHPDITVDYTKETGKGNPDKDSLNVSDSGVKMRLSVKNSLENYDAHDFSAESDEFEITPYTLHVKADDIMTTYGTNLPQYSSGYGYTYDEADFRYGQNEEKLIENSAAGYAAYVRPTIRCMERDGITPINERTESDIYTININGTRAENYNIIETNGQLNIFQKGIVISKINGIPSLSSMQAFNKETTHTYTVETNNLPSEDGISLEYEGDNRPLAEWDDAVKITFTVTYPNASVIGETDVNITNWSVDSKWGSANNYYLHNVLAPQKGSIDDAVITDIQMSFDPVFEAAEDGSVAKDEEGNNKKRAYTYGDKIDLSTARFIIKYNSGRIDGDPRYSKMEISKVTFDMLPNYGITAVYTNSGQPVIDGEFLTVDRFNGESITFTAPSDDTIIDDKKGMTITTDTFTVSKRIMHIQVKDAEYTYGEVPPEDMYNFDFEEADLAKGDTIESAFTDDTEYYSMPDFQCKIDGKTLTDETARKLNAGKYTGAITMVAGTGSSRNYKFVSEGDYEGALTVNKRQLNITNISDRSAIPPLSAYEMAQHDYKLPIDLDSVAGNTVDKTQLEINEGDVKNNDEILITFKARYNNLEDNNDADVDIIDVAFAEDCPAKDNYIINPDTVVKTALGSVHTRLMSKIEVLEDPGHTENMEYEYGDFFHLEGGKVRITYDSEEYDEATFNELPNYGIKIKFVKYDDQTNKETGNVADPQVNKDTVLTVPVHDGTRIKLEPDGSVAAKANIKPAYTLMTMKVKKHPLRVFVHDQSFVYGTSPVVDGTAWHYNSNDLVNADTVTSIRFLTEQTVHPTVICEELDGADVDGTTPAGEYELLTITNGSNPNYELVPVKGTLTIQKLPIKISSITGGAKNLTADKIYENNSTPPITVTGNSAVYEKSVKQIEFEDGYGVINDDEIGIVYDQIYDTVTPDSEPVQVKIAAGSVKFDKVHKDNNNYTIDYVTTDYVTGGRIIMEQVSKVTIENDPTLRDDNRQPIEYVHGDPIDLNRGSVTVEFDSGKALYNLKFSEIKDATNGMVTVVYEDGDEDIEISDGDRLIRAKNDGVPLKLKITSDRYLVYPKTEKLSVGKAEMVLKAEDSSRGYGEPNPTFTYKYYLDGNEYTDVNSDDFLAGFVKPSIYSNANAKANVGEYEIIIDNGESTNYVYKYENATLTIEKRPLRVLAVTSGIPTLTSKILYENPNEFHVLSGTASVTSGQLSLDNLVAGDDIRITYEAVYSGDREENDVQVRLVNIKLDEGYEQSANYTLDSVPGTSDKGNIREKQISSIEIVRQPKLSYNYGDNLDLTGRGVRITYDDGSAVSNIAYNELAEYNVSLTYTDNNGNVTDLSDPSEADNIVMTYGRYNGTSLTLTPQTTLPVAPVETRPVTVNKKPLNVIIKNVNSVYGEEHAPNFEFEYNIDDFAEGDYDTESNAPADGVITAEPTFVCNDRTGKAVDNRTSAGIYTISMSGGDSDNYQFVYNNGILNIKKRPLVVTDIKKPAIPGLSSAAMYQKPGEEHKIESAAGNELLEFGQNAYGDSLVKDEYGANDRVEIRFNVVYHGVTENSACDVGIEYLGMVNTSGKSSNYEISSSSVKRLEGVGEIHERQITDIQIATQPTLDYVYGDELLSENIGGEIYISYDSGFEETIPFKDYASRGLKLSYVDEEGNITPASSSDKVSVPLHQGSSLQLEAESTYSVTPQITENVISITPVMLEFGDCEVDTIPYDGQTTITTGKVIFKNPQNGDDIKTTATFRFEDADIGENKTVYITDIRLESPFDQNYELPASQTTARGTISKAKDTITLTAADIKLGSEDNVIRISAPDMTPTQVACGAEYEYSIDGGSTWSKDSVFDELELAAEYRVCVRFAETENYAASEPTEPVTITTYRVRLTLVSRERPTTGTEHKILKTVYTNTGSVESEKDLRALIGDVTDTDDKGETKTITYYKLYEELEGGSELKFPLILVDEGERSADKTIYTTLTSSSNNIVHSSSGSGQSVQNTATLKIEIQDEYGNVSTQPEINTTVDSEPISLIVSAKNAGKDPAIVWKSEDSKVASVNARGVVTIHGVGTTVIMAYLQNNKGVKAMLTINVSDEPQPTLDPVPDKNIPYLHGFTGMIKPDDYMTRAEAATIMLQLLGRTGEHYPNSFPDVREGTWYIDVIAEATARGLISGYDGKFYPEKPVTREQFAAMVARMTDLEPIPGQTFEDVEDWRWSAGSVNAAVKKGIVVKRDNFLPENPIRRSEAVRMINVATGRIPDKQYIDTLLCPYTDLPKTHWAYYEFMVAAAEFDIPQTK